MKTVHKIIARELSNFTLSEIAALHVDLAALLSHLRDAHIMDYLSNHAIRGGRTPAETQSLYADTANEWISTAPKV